MRYICMLLALSFATLASNGFAATVSEEIEPYLVEGQLAEGIKFFKKRAEQQDPEAQYAVGVLKLLVAVEGLSQDLYRYGLKPESPDLPLLRLPVPENPKPKKITYNKWRKLLQDFVDDLESAQTTLEGIEADDAKLKVPFGMIKLDLNGDGKATEKETLWKIFTQVARVRAELTEDEQRFEIGFDKADVHWMIGYTHLLQALVEAWLAYDTEEFFVATSPIFFDGASANKFPFDSGQDGMFDADRIADLIAAIHLFKFQVAEPERMKASLKHLQTTIAESRLVWECVDKETDDDREWIPGPKQTSITPLRVEQEQVDGWRMFLDEAEAVLAGKKLIPHWRIRDKRAGINLKCVFSEPRDFDLVMWAHGAAALPYLEGGECISGEDGRTLQRMFNGNFFGFAVWFN